MPFVSDVLRVKKSSAVISIEADATILQAVELMNEKRIGALLVMRGAELAGIFTERDILTRVVGRQLDLNSTRVCEVMTSEVLCCEPTTDLEDIAEIMLSRRIRHLPVRDAQHHIVGLVSIGDINAFNVMHKQATIDNLSDYVLGRG